MDRNKPSIKIYVHPLCSVTGELNSIFWGIEEEGLLYETMKCDSNSVTSLAYSAALDSRVDVGIGIGEDGRIVLHYAKLKEDSPLFISNLKSGKNNLRAIGANAARLVKGIPFKFEDDD